MEILQTQQMINIVRFSRDAFLPQKQDFHYETHVQLHLDEEYFQKEIIEKSINAGVIPGVIKEMERIHKNLKSFYSDENVRKDLEYGVWVFIDGHLTRQSLNHLKKWVPCYKAQISPDAIVYDVNWEKQIKMNDPLCKSWGCYIPYRSMTSITNIDRFPNPQFEF